MKTKTEVMMATVAVAVYCTAFAPGAWANCGSEAPQWAMVSPSVQTFPSQTSLTTAFKVRHDDPADSAPPGASIVGLWEMANTPNIGPNAGKVTLRGIESWHSDGTEALNDFHNPAGGNVCLGVWMQTGPRTFKLKHPYWMWDSTGTLIGSGVLRWEVTVDADGNSYTGTFTNDQVDLLGNSVNHVAGDTKATRITVD